MKTKSYRKPRVSLTFAFFFLPFAFCLLSSSLLAQPPHSFNYQAVARDNNGGVLKNTPLDVRLTLLQGSGDGTAVWTETHSVTTNAFGLFSVVAGSITPLETDWSAGPYFLKTETDLHDGNGWKTMGTVQILSVPYAIRAESVNDLKQLKIQGSDLASDSALFEVKRKDGQTVFAVYNEGVRVYVDDTPAKGPRGGFAIGGFDAAKGLTNEYMRVTPDSVRIYLNNAPKGPRGGFAIGGFDAAKGAVQEYLRVTHDSTRIYINSRTKGPRGGFAIGGFDVLKKGTNPQYFNVSAQDKVDVINPSQPGIFWYPGKEAFLAGRVLIESPDSVGTNSMATGYESKSIGNYSQAFGYSARAKGDNSTAIGNNANAEGNESYAFGNFAATGNTGSYAIGSGAKATGLRSFAVGSVGVDSADILTSPTQATGDYSYAFGMGSVASGKGAFAIGTQNIASGNYSLALGYDSRATAFYATAMGYKTNALWEASTALGWRTVANGSGATALGSYSRAGANATAMGFRAVATGYASTAIGYRTEANNDYSVALCGNTRADGLFSIAMGYGSAATGDYSTAMGTARSSGRWTTATGRGTIARSFCSFAAGAYNDTSSTSSTTSWVDSDPLFIVGNGTWDNRHNAMTIKKDGSVYFPDVYSVTVSPLYRDLYIDFSGKIGYLSSSRRYKKEIRPMEDIDWLYRLKPVNFRYKADHSGMKQYGLIAEDVEKVNPLFVSYNEQGRPETVQYSRLITPMLKALQEQRKTIEALQKKIDKLESEKSGISALQQQLAEQARMISRLQQVIMGVAGK